MQREPVLLLGPAALLVFHVADPLVDGALAEFLDVQAAVLGVDNMDRLIYGQYTAWLTEQIC